MVDQSCGARMASLPGWIGGGKRCHWRPFLFVCPRFPAISPCCGAFAFSAPPGPASPSHLTPLPRSPRCSRAFALLKQFCSTRDGGRTEGKPRSVGCWRPSGVSPEAAPTSATHLGHPDRLLPHGPFKRRHCVARLLQADCETRRIWFSTRYRGRKSVAKTRRRRCTPPETPKTLAETMCNPTSVSASFFRG